MLERRFCWNKGRNRLNMYRTGTPVPHRCHRYTYQLSISHLLPAPVAPASLLHLSLSLSLWTLYLPSPTCTGATDTLIISLFLSLSATGVSYYPCLVLPLSFLCFLSLFCFVFTFKKLRCSFWSYRCFYVLAMGGAFFHCLRNTVEYTADFCSPKILANSNFNCWRWTRRIIWLN